MSKEHPQILFVPVSSGKGAGEYIRSLLIAKAIKERWPGSKIRFCLSREAPYLDSVPFEVFLTERSATFHVREINDFMRQNPPDIVIFDNSGRRSQLKCAKKLGARTIFLTIGGRLRKRLKAFRLWKMAVVDEHWMVQPSFSFKPLSFREKLLLKVLNNHQFRRFDVFFSPPDVDRRNQLEKRLGLAGDPYILFAPGGGGHRVDGRYSSEIFAEAASGVADQTGIRCVLVMGPLYPDDIPIFDGVVSLSSLPDYELIDLMSNARLVACGGGDIVSQSLALGRVCVAATTGAKDQSARIRTFSELGLVKMEEADSGSIRDAVVHLLEDEAGSEMIRQRVLDANVENGLPRAIEILESRLAEAKVAE